VDTVLLVSHRQHFCGIIGIVFAALLSRNYSVIFLSDFAFSKSGRSAFLPDLKKTPDSGWSWTRVQPYICMCVEVAA